MTKTAMKSVTTTPKKDADEQDDTIVPMMTVPPFNRHATVPGDIYPLETRQYILSRVYWEPSKQKVACTHAEIPRLVLSCMLH